jgi:hypothetical protein
LAARWRAEAELLRAHGAVEAAETKSHDADELERWLTARNDAPLTLQQAATESGFSVAHLRRLVALHVIANVGDNGDVRVTRGSLPRKPGRARGPSLTGDVLGIPTGGGA